MMVEAGAKLLPEDVMAEAILFGHRALQPLIDLQEQLREAVGKPKRTPYLEPGTDSVLDFVDGRRRQARVRRRRRRDDRHGPEDGRPRSRSAPSRSRAARSPTAGRPSSTRAQPIVGHQMHGITDKDVTKAPERRPTPPSRPSTFVGDALVVGHNVGFDLGFLEEALGDGTHFERAATSTR